MNAQEPQSQSAYNDPNMHARLSEDCYYIDRFTLTEEGSLYVYEHGCDTLCDAEQWMKVNAQPDQRYRITKVTMTYQTVQIVETKER